MLLICKYDFIYLFSNLLRQISLNGPSGRKKAQEGGETLWGIRWEPGAGLGGPDGAHQGAGALPWPNQAMWG